jgi:hypothetical protein
MPPQPSSTEPDQTRRQEERRDLDRPHPGERGDELVQEAARQAGLDEVPMAQQHRVGHGAEERGTGDRPRERDGGVAASVERRRDESYRPDGDGQQIEHGRELRAAARLVVVLAALDAGHRRDA